MRPALGTGKPSSGRRLAKRPPDVQQAGLSFPSFVRRLKIRKSRRNPAASIYRRPQGAAASEPIRTAVTVRARAAVALHPAMPPALAAVHPVVVGEQRQAPLLAVVKRLVE